MPDIGAAGDGGAGRTLYTRVWRAHIDSDPKECAAAAAAPAAVLLRLQVGPTIIPQFGGTAAVCSLCTD